MVELDIIIQVFLSWELKGNLQSFAIKQIWLGKGNKKLNNRNIINISVLIIFLKTEQNTEKYFLRLVGTAKPCARQDLNNVRWKNGCQITRIKLKNK